MDRSIAGFSVYVFVSLSHSVQSDTFVYIEFVPEHDLNPRVQKSTRLCCWVRILHHCDTPAPESPDTLTDDDKTAAMAAARDL
jgi:hypothetical protein